jgi:hypothetical protein
VKTITDRRHRYGHLIGLDRLRVVAVYADGQRITESFEEPSLPTALQTGATLTAPPSSPETPGRIAADATRLVTIEIHLGRWLALGDSDCEWADSRPLMTGRVSDGAVAWSEAVAAEPDPEAGQQLALI